jgi:UDP-N-acetylglucosamine 2-epimerase (non-hydrolysing)
MNSSKVLFVLGTRPEGIKLAPLYLQMKERQDFQVRMCSTGQHREMLDQVLDFFQIKPDYSLNVMRENQTLSHVTQAILQDLDKVFDDFAPDVVVVQGDTTTVLAGALGAFYRNIKIAHVEAGLRTWNIHTPFPEEANRVLVSKLADYHFAPTREASENLKKDNVDERNIYEVGNTVTDAIVMATDIVNKRDDSIAHKFEEVDFDKKVILITAHRRENLGQGIDDICSSIASIAAQEGVEVIFPVHLNPKVRDVVYARLSQLNNVHLMDPLDYPELVWVMDHCYMVMTDSGGIQEEAPSLGKPVLVMRESTERPEGIEAGTAKLVGTNYELITETANKLLDNTDGLYDQMAHAVNPYGDGKCSLRIIDVLSNKTQL